MSQSAYDGAADFFRRGPWAPFVEEIRQPRGSPLSLVRLRQPAGHYPDPPLPEISIQLFTAGAGIVESDCGLGRRRQRFTNGLVNVAPAEATVDCLLDGGFEATTVNVSLAGLTSKFESAGSLASDLEPLYGLLAEDSFVSSLVQRMWVEAAQDSPRGRLFLDGAVLALVTTLLAKAEGLHLGQLTPPLARGGLAPWRLRRALDRMDAGLADDVSIDALAEAAGLSPSHFARAFKAETGTTPWRHLLVRRVERAKDLLATTDLSLTEVASDCGFADRSHLSGWFRRITGATPKQWRDAKRS